MSQNKYSYTLTTISKVILSPREQGAYYRALNEFDDNDLKTEMTKKATIIYPFYQYGEYEKYQPKNTKYFIPGSSIKGMLVKNEDTPNRGSNDLLVDDLTVDFRKITLSSLTKFQKEPNKDTEIGEFDDFFLNVAVEMCIAGAKFEGEMFYQSKEDLDKHLEKTHESTIQMLKRLMERLEKLRTVQDQKKTEELSHIYDNLQKLITDYSCKHNCFLAVLGGYKGRTLSHLFETEEVTEGAIFLDTTTYLPYGLVLISELVEVDA